MLRISRADWQSIIDHSLAEAEKPAEACGLIAGELDDMDVRAVYPCGNVAPPESQDVIYELDSRDYLRADRDARSKGWEIIGVYHSHTHTQAYPSPTDIAQAPDPSWHYVVASVQRPSPVVRCYTIVDGDVAEVPLVLERPPPPSAPNRH
ncbi:MAG: M67 family metallopeptidase [Acidimicrobiales bacterium]